MTLSFDPEDPFPLIAGRGFSYEDEKQHSAAVDEWLGLRCEAIEAQLRTREIDGDVSRDSNREFWIGKSVQTFLTPYSELRAILEDVNCIKTLNGELIVDLGAGFGRLAHVLARNFPDSTFVGYEIIRERQEEGQRVIETRGLLNANLVACDVSTLDFDEIDASVIFLYDFGSRADIEATMEALKKRSASKPFTIVARGGRSRDIIEKRHQWLSQVVNPLHRDHYSIYRTHEAES